VRQVYECLFLPWKLSELNCNLSVLENKVSMCNNKYAETIRTIRREWFCHFAFIMLPVTPVRRRIVSATITMAKDWCNVF
jgi:hypothetical protein